MPSPGRTDYRAAMRCLTLALSLLLAAPALAADPDAFDPLLDLPPEGDARDQTYEAPDPRSPGFTIGGFGGWYIGSVKSFLTKDRSTLTSGSRPFVGFGFGGRTRSPIELGIDIGLGLGQTFLPKYNINVAAFDLILAPRLLVHLYESPGLGVYTGAAGEAILFDVEPAGLNQAGIGPALVVGLLRRLGPHSFIFAEVTASAFYDLLAFKYVPPDEEALLEDPTLEPKREDGEWYGIARFTLGYRLTAF